MNTTSASTPHLDLLTTRFAPSQRTVPGIFLAGAQQHGAKPLLKIPGGAWSHAEAPDHIARRAGSLLDIGVQRNQAVAFMCGNRIELLETFLATGWIGAISVPINTASMAPQIEYFLANSGAVLLAIEADYLPRLTGVDLSRTQIHTIWVIGSADAPSLPGSHELNGVSVHPYPAAGAAVEPADIAPGDTLAILYTSGTTGPAKGVMCPHAQYFWWGAHAVDALQIDSTDRLCTTLPLFHINALHGLCQASLAGASIAYLPRFSASRFWTLMREHEATIGYLLGAMAPMLLAQTITTDERQHKVRCILGPGVPAAAGQALYERTGAILIEGYGSTETNFAIATKFDTPPSGIMGWVRPHFEAQVVDEQDNPLPDGEAGELVLRSTQPYAFATGYFNMPEQTVEAWRNLWFHTGDRVVRQADGAFRFLDRLKDSIRRRGENISSYEVEAVLLSHPAIASAAAYPVRSDLAEDEVMVSVCPSRDDQGQALSVLPEDLIAYCEERLPRFAIPRYVDIVDDLPRTANGKVQKFVLRDRGITSTTWDKNQHLG